jgi:3-phosphoinositide dependent protein kinase-1
LYQVIEPTQRLGCEELGGVEKLKSHPFFEGIDWAHLSVNKPPELLPYLPATTDNPGQLWSRVGIQIKNFLIRVHYLP